MTELQGPHPDSERLNRVTFFARYEASCFGSMRIQLPHLFLGLLREDRGLVAGFLGSPTAVTGLRQQIEETLPRRTRLSTSIDIPMAPECRSLIDHAYEYARGSRPEAALNYLFLGMLKTDPGYFQQYGLVCDAVARSIEFPELPPITAAQESPLTLALLEFRSVLLELEATLRPMPEERTRERLLAGGWSRKQLVGHLIDSASNNHQRFVRALLSADGELIFPDYDSDAWVNAAGYQELPWTVLMDLCISYNRALFHLLDRSPAEKFDSIRCRIGERPAVSLTELVRDYVTHFSHHVRQITG